ncbi:MAG: leucine--tRNA ligase, partial [Bacteroidetes bacterium]
SEYNFSALEPKWQAYWQENSIYKVENPSSEEERKKPKYYALDMFPYPSGAGLHVGHPLGYIATDIISRYKRMQGYNVLHPMGFDSFGLPAEQYAIETGQHPAITTEQNIATFKAQLAKIGFNYDWGREVRTSEPSYYRWTQWIFQQLFESWYNNKTQKAEPIATLVGEFEKNGNTAVNAPCDDDTPTFDAKTWLAYTADMKQRILLKYRLTYLADAFVNWCPALGSVLANDEVKDGLSERGGHPVERKKMRQWMMRITAYADRLLDGLQELDWSDALKEMQRNWIGKSIGCEINFKTNDIALTAFTTRIDTIFGVSYLVLAPEHDIIPALTTEAQKAEVEKYVIWAKNRSERERQAEVKTVSGMFTGSYAVNPFSGEQVPIWVADYVLSGYGTGVVMGVPASDERDFRFATHFGLPIVPIIDRTVLDEAGKVKEAYSEKVGKMINSSFLNGLEVKEAISKAIEYVVQNNLGKAKVNFRLRDAVFGRQRYWGEPVPVKYDANGLPHLISPEELPLILPEIDEYKPTADGEPPLARAKNWQYEASTMPGWAGSSWYFLRYMDNQNSEKLVDFEVAKYWNQVDLYVGGTEHAVGHLLYSRFWNHFLFDRGHIAHREPFKKLINQGMIQGMSALVYRIKDTNKFITVQLKDQYETQELHADVNIVENNILDTEKFKAWREDYADAEFIMAEDGKFHCGSLVEKMSKRWYNVVNPDDVVGKYGADTLRLYEMFLGPLEVAKPWNTNGIDGTYKFLRKLWRLFYGEHGTWQVSEETPSPAEYKALHKSIKKITEDLERFSFNTPVSEFMICVNALQELKCSKREILQDFIKLLAPFAPHITEELWHALGNSGSIHHADFPKCNEAYLVENSFEYPIQINGKHRANLSLPTDMSKEDIEKAVLNSEAVQKYLEGNSPKKVVVVPKKIVNVVI